MGICSAQDSTAWPVTGTITIGDTLSTEIGYLSGGSLEVDAIGYPLFDSVSHISIYHDSLTYELDIKPDRYFIHEQAWIFFMLDVDRRLKVIEQRLGILNKKE